MSWKKELIVNNEQYTYFDLSTIVANYQKKITDFPYSIRVLLESLARHQEITDLEKLIGFDSKKPTGVVPFRPSRVVLQDFTGVPAVVDLAAMRDAVVALGGDPKIINPEIPVTLVVDHSVQVDHAGTKESLSYNTEKEFERNHERYQFLKWAQQAFDNFDVVPPETGIIHQVNLEYLSDVILKDEENLLFPDSLEGTDSHTTMINGLGVLGWGVGGIEAEAAILGEASYFPTPEVIGVEVIGTLSPGATATDLALFLTELLRSEKVVGKFVEYFGSGYKNLSLSDRATIANMAPEYGATCGFCPIDEETLSYLRLTGRSEEQVDLVEAYAKQNQLFYDGTKTPCYTRVIHLDLSTVHSSLAGPKRPQDRILLAEVAENFQASLTKPNGPQGFGLAAAEIEREIVLENTKDSIETGDLVLAAITSCTNTSNPSVMVAAGLLAKKAVKLGLRVPKTIKTSLAPGSKIVTSYLEKGHLLEPLAELGFDIVGYGCTTCIGNSGPLEAEIETGLKESELVVSAVLSGNRNFEGRIHPLIKANYLASPPLVIAYALAGTIKKDLTKEPLATIDGKAIYLKDLWPAQEEVNAYINDFLDPKDFRDAYKNIYHSNERWNQIETSKGACYEWDDASTYIANPPFFTNLNQTIDETTLKDLAVLAKFGDTVTTDHISPAGNIGLQSPAGKYLKDHNIAYKDFNSFGSRRGNHEVMMRGTFGNIRIQNQLTPETTGGYTKLATGEELSIYDAAMVYQKKQIGTLILAGKDYGMGSSRDWAAKGTNLLGVKAVLAESYERIHRSNLVMMGVVPFEYLSGETAQTLGLTGIENYSFDFPSEPYINQVIDVTAQGKQTTHFKVKLRFDSEADIAYWKNQGILPLVIHKKIRKEQA
ncbi:aconitate hydratase AcnA [Enterococcus xiangfangensis]|uniref:Aconitate hydratase n=1 Tax=Enterococcus xiangfangensis TaxID=1296537 RepID=A0ABU3F695_9ENTE|nr:aconitate hydratase AcnA [Enterococcus xiangfangensis]MDT2758191.1 aconitate hydratase AcnA [Enterococcus xiangfangensis]